MHTVRKFARWLGPALSAVALLGCTNAEAQRATSLAEVKKVFVQRFDGGEGAEMLQQDVTRRIAKGRFQVVASKSEADAVLKGTGKVWVRGYTSVNVRTPGRDRRAAYAGYLSLELMGAGGEPLWSWMVTPGKLTWNNVVDDLGGHAAKKLLEDASAAAPAAASLAAAQSGVMAHLAGGGATFPAPLYRMWFQEFGDAYAGLHLEYAPIGSQAGLEKLVAGGFDFAGSDVQAGLVLPTDDASKLRSIPTVLGAVVPIYNLGEGVHDLHLTGEVLAAIYLGRATRWNDPVIQRSNDDVKLPDLPIVVVHRSDGSGTTWVWSDFLSASSPAWAGAVSRGTTLQWPVGVGVERNDGVAETVRKTPGSIGYVELTYAIQNEMTFAAVKNRAGAFIHADLESVLEAARTSKGTGLINASGKDAYPITSFTWLFYPAQARDAAKGDTLKQLLRWILTSGQNSCSALGYAPLPHEVAEEQLRILDNHR